MVHFTAQIAATATRYRLGMQDAVELNEEFRIKWPRGEMGALPDDAKQDLRIMYIQEDVDQLKYVVKALEIDNAKK